VTTVKQLDLLATSFW